MAMTWHSSSDNERSWCEFDYGADKPAELKVLKRTTGTWAWFTTMNDKCGIEADGYGCASESKARRMAMASAAMFAQILDMERPHEDN